ncbi:SMI1/KNR4 family protein [Paenibacillus sp. MABNR03]|uniref:SMI1/KNR4 family protein n=1 Tax=Paenibacillus sp. MABNR03 TaxID=3142626 RepID=UPI003D2D4D61
MLHRALLLKYGACNFGDPALYSVKELDWAYPAFVEAYREYKKEYDRSDDLNPCTSFQWINGDAGRVCDMGPGTDE